MSDSLLSSPRLAIFFNQHVMITDGITDGTPVENNGLVKTLLCNSASQNILPRMGKTMCSCAQVCTCVLLCAVFSMADW